MERYYINAWRKNTLEYKDIYKLWFSDGFHEDSFENIFNFEEWLHEHELFLTKETTLTCWALLQYDRAEHFMNEVNRKNDYNRL